MAVIKRVYLCTRSEQTWIVPVGVTSAIFECWGASGGADYFQNGLTTPYPAKTDAASAAFDIASTNSWVGGINGGSGPVGYVKGTLAVTAGATYYLEVGGNGENGPGSSVLNAGWPTGYTVNGLGTTTGGAGGWNGGGAGGQGWHLYATSTSDWAYAGSGGGGATDIRTGGNALGNRVLVAGGAGGAGGGWGTRNYGAVAFTVFPVAYGVNPTTPPYNPAYPAGYFIGGAGVGGYGGGGGGERGVKSDLSALAGGVPSGGGSTTAGGTAGTNTDTTGFNGTAGASGVGGAGAASTGTPVNSVNGGGGGGGGYFGGGGGGSGTVAIGTPWSCGGGGGGGANFVGGSFTATTNASHLWPEPALTPTDPRYQYPWATAAAQFYPGGFVRLTYVVPPSAPVVANPGLQARVPVSLPFNIAWVFHSLASADGPVLDGGADVVYTFSGVDTLTYVPPQLIGASEGQTAHFILPANTLTAGRTYTMKVRTYDSNGDVGPYCTPISFRTIAAPSAPVITAPATNADLDPASFTVTWTNPNGAGTELLYRVVVTGESDGALLDTDLVHSGTRLNLSPDPVMKSSLGTWTASGGTAATDTKTDPWAVANCYKVTWTGKTSFSEPIITVPGVTYTFSGYFASVASTDPAMAMAAIDPTSGAKIAQGATVAVAGTPGNWQKVSVTFTALAGTTTLAFIPVGGSTSASYFSSSMVEVGPALGLYFGTATSKDPGVSGTITTTTDGFQTLAGTDVLSQNFTTWPSGPSEYVNVRVYLATLGSVEYMVSSVVECKVNKLPPGTALVTLTTSDAAGMISLAVTCVDTPHATSTVDIYRSKVGVANSEIRLAHVVPDVTRAFTFVDYTPGTDTLYQYRVRAWSLSGGFEDTT